MRQICNRSKANEEKAHTDKLEFVTLFRNKKTCKPLRGLEQCLNQRKSFTYPKAYLEDVEHTTRE